MVKSIKCWLGYHMPVYCEGWPTMNEDCWRCKHCHKVLIVATKVSAPKIADILRRAE
jgi:hypothetical protein